MQQNQQHVEAWLSQVQNKITNIVLEHPETRSDFLKNCRGSIKKYIGVELPAEWNIQVIDAADANEVVFVLPHHNVEQQHACSGHDSSCCSGNVNDADLRNVAGGSSNGANNANIQIKMGPAGIAGNTWESEKRGCFVPKLQSNLQHPITYPITPSATIGGNPFKGPK